MTLRIRSLRSRVLAWGLGLLGLGVVLAVLLGVATFVVQARLAQLTKSLVEEQRLADRITAGVMRQLAAQTAPPAEGDRPMDAARAAFNGAGDQVKEALRAYLLRELSVQARQQLELVKEQHRLMEVSALLAMNTDGMFGDLPEARLAFNNGGITGSISLSRALAADSRLTLQAEATTYALDLMRALNAFRRLRDDDIAAREAEFRQDLETLWLARVLFIGGFTALVVLLMLRGTRRRIAEPLAALRAVSRRLGRGELDVRAPDLADAELQALGQAFNLMAEELAEAQRALRLRNEELERALHEVQATQRDLLEAEKLGAVGRMTAGLAHELNNPLATVVGLTDLLAQESREGRVFTPAELRDEFIAPVLSQATRASKLVRSLLAVSRRGGATVEPLSIPHVLGTVLDLRRHGFEQVGLALTHGALPECHVRADAQQLQSIFLNVVDNALDAMRGRPGGTLHVTCQVAEGMLTICFDDTGPGLDDPNMVFEPFFTTKGVGEGTGLGLWLSRRFVEAAGGTMRGESRAEGGARFRITLPATDAPSREPVPAAVAERVPVSLGDRTVLVVDDEPDLRALAARAMARLGLTVLTAASGAEARAVLARAPTVEAIVSDVRMPGESGIELYHWVREVHPHLATRVLFVTGDMSDDLLSSLPGEVQGQVLLKPFDLSDYLARVQALLA